MNIKKFFLKKQRPNFSNHKENKMLPSILYNLQGPNMHPTAIYNTVLET